MFTGCSIVLLMPGPTNTLLAAAGLQQGLPRAARLSIAELAGYLVSISLWGICLGHASHSIGWLPTVLRLASSVYLFWLAVRLWLSADTIHASTNRQIGPRTLFGATVLNPKAILLAGSIFPSTAFENLTEWCEAMAIFTLLLIPIGIAWVAFGAASGSGRLPHLRPALFQRCASVIVGAFSLALLGALAR